MARLAASRAHVPSTLKSTFWFFSLNPGPKRVLCTSTTFTSAPIATFRVTNSPAQTDADSATARTKTPPPTHPLCLMTYLLGESHSGRGGIPGISPIDSSPRLPVLGSGLSAPVHLHFLTWKH